MDLVNSLNQAGVLDSIARQLAVDPATAQAGAAALLPAVMGGFKKQAQPEMGGLGGLADMLGGAGGGNLLDMVASGSAAPGNTGNEILGQIFGSKDVSRTVAGQASQSTGIDPALLKQMLPILAMAVTGYLARQQGGAAPQAADSSGGGLGGILGNVLGGVLGGNQGAAPQSSGGLGRIASMLDLDGDGNPLDDIIGMAGKLRG